MYRIKSDNCSCQYKCKCVFQRYKLLASSTKKTFVLYFGVSWHGKGLVDARSGFGVKKPIQRVIILENEFFYTSKDIVEYLEKKMKQPNRFYIPVDEEKLRNEQKDKGEFKIHGCTSLHMLSFLPNGIICGKQNLCSCDECNVGKSYHCKIERGMIYRGSDAINDDVDDDGEGDDDLEEEDDYDECADDEHEQNELPRRTYFDLINVGSYIAIYSYGKATYLFYICKVLDKGVAEGQPDQPDQTHIKDGWGHPIELGPGMCNCILSRKSRRRGKVYTTKS